MKRTNQHGCYSCYWCCSSVGFCRLPTSITSQHAALSPLVRSADIIPVILCFHRHAVISLFSGMICFVWWNHLRSITLKGYSHFRLNGAPESDCLRNRFSTCVASFVFCFLFLQCFYLFSLDALLCLYVHMCALRTYLVCEVECLYSHSN